MRSMPFSSSVRSALFFWAAALRMRASWNLSWRAWRICRHSRAASDMLLQPCMRFAEQYVNHSGSKS